MARLEQVETDKQGIRRRATSRGLSFGPIATAITVGAVAVLLGVTFIGDWLRTPKISAEASPSLISPNGDQAQDSTNFSYTLNEDAHVSVQVLNENNVLVRTLATNEFQTRGQHVAAWDGRDNLGQTVADGPYRLEVTGKGTVMAGSQSVTVVVDTQPPTLRLANLEETSRVRDASLTIEGLTDPDAVVQVAGEPQIVPINADGRFSLKRQLAEGSNNLKISATDPAGNVATLSREIILATKPPEIAIASPNNDTWTKESLITVSGTVPAGASLKVNGQDATVAADGQFQREVILQEGDNILRIEATDDVGNVTSQEIIIHRKSSTPSLSVNVDDGATFQQEEVQIIGKTDAGAAVLVGGKTVAVSSLGEFQTTVNLLNGDNLLDVVAQDQAGNATKLQRRLRFELTPPESELDRVARNLPGLSVYFVPVLISLPILLILAYMLTRPVALVLSAESGMFRPGLPEEGRFLRIGIDLSKPARTTVEVKDGRGNVIATLLHRRHRGAGQQNLYWNGYDDFGRVVVPGDYTIHATASTTGGTVTGTINVAILEDKAVHRQYLRRTPFQGDEQTQVSSRNGELVRSTARRVRRR